jgi:hypothetical protein
MRRVRWVNVPGPMEPMAIARMWPRLAFGLVEGLYTPGTVHGLASACALGVGLLIGGVRLGFTDLYTEAIALMATLLAVGIVFSGLGAGIALGIAAGDIAVTLGRCLIGLLTSDSSIWACAATVASRLLVYSVLLSLVVFIPQSARYAARSVRLPRRVAGWRAAGAVRWVLTTALTVLFVWIWSETVPLLTRPLFTWSGRTPPVISPDSHAHDRDILLIVAVCACAARAALRRAMPACATPPRDYAAVRALVRKRLEQAEQQPTWRRVAWMTSVMTFMLSGLCQSWLDGALLAAAMATCYGAYFFDWFSSPRLTAMLARFPVAVRAAIWVGAWLLFAWAMTGLQSSGAWPAFAMAVFSILTFSVLLGAPQRSQPR